MKLYLLTRRKDDADYHDYTSAVVAAASERDAIRTHPGGYVWSADGWLYPRSPHTLALNSGWPPSRRYVKAKYIGDAAPGVESGVICASNVGA